METCTQRGRKEKQGEAPEWMEVRERAKKRGRDGELEPSSGAERPGTAEGARGGASLWEASEAMRRLDIDCGSFTRTANLRYLNNCGLDSFPAPI